MFFGLFEGPLKAPAFGSCTMAVCRMRPEIVKTIPAAAATLSIAGRGYARDPRQKQKHWVCRASRPFEERPREVLAMPNIHVLTGAGESPAYPVVRKIGVADLKDALAKGIDDFLAMPTHVIFLAVIYPSLACFWPA